MIILLWLGLTVTVLALMFTWLLRRYALAKNMIDIPNMRSSHSVPTPRGGGLAIVSSFLITLPFLWVEDLIADDIFFALSGAGLVTAILGFFDDHGHIAARWRLLGHFSAAGWVLYWLGGVPTIKLFGADVDLEWLGYVFTALYLVWMLNLYNFMDGIDGLASVEALCVCLGSCLIYWFVDAKELIWLPLLLSTAVLGFLFWNFPPAKIFMGDVGSGFLGVTLGVLSLQAAWHSEYLLWVWLILLGVFIVDATVTLIQRLKKGCKVYEAHRSHAYQFASRRMGSHMAVTLSVLVINIFWLLPIALCVALLGLNGLIGLAVAYIPLVVLAVKYQAGEKEGL